MSLTVILLISVFGFITLTNVSWEYGLFTQQLPGQPPSEGLLIRKYNEKSHMPFEPLEQTICEQLKERPEVTMVVPMIENTPS